MGRLSFLGGIADGVVEPLLLFALGIGQVEHQRVEQVGVADEQTQVMVGAGSLLGELAAGGVGQVVGLSDAHFLFGLIWSTGVGGCGSGEQRRSHFSRHGFVYIVVWCV